MLELFLFILICWFLFSGDPSVAATLRDKFVKILKDEQ